MARKLRVQYPGAVYHVMNRGDRRKPVFKDDQDRQTFLRTLGEACAKTRWRLHAWCLMPNHFHLVLTTPQANLVVESTRPSARNINKGVAHWDWRLAAKRLLARGNGQWLGDSPNP
jgi:REP element-mobilizing transposase RayT